MGVSGFIHFPFDANLNNMPIKIMNGTMGKTHSFYAVSCVVICIKRYKNKFACL